MNARPPPASTHPSLPVDLHGERVADALHYWEPRRAAYNAVLALVVAVVFATHAAQLQARFSFDMALALFLLAVLANVAYCAAYPADLFVQRSGLPAVRRRVRPVLLVVGTLFAAVLAQFIARGMVAGG